MALLSRQQEVHLICKNYHYSNFKTFSFGLPRLTLSNLEAFASVSSWNKERTLELFLYSKMNLNNTVQYTC